MKHIAQRKTVLLRQRDIQSVVSSCSLQFEIEPDTKTLAQRQSPGLIDAAAKRSVDHKLHPPAFIEKAFRDHRALRWNRSQNSAPLQDVFNRLLSARIIQPTLFFEPAYRRGHGRLRRRKSYRGGMRQHLANLLPQLTHMSGKLFRPRRGLSTPERNTGRRSVRILHQHSP